MVITVITREWFNKRSGHASFTATAIVDGKKIEIPYTDGYGEYYQQVAFEVMKKEGMLPIPVVGKEVLHEYCSRNNIILNTQKIEVVRQKDL